MLDIVLGVRDELGMQGKGVSLQAGTQPGPPEICIWLVPHSASRKPFRLFGWAQYFWLRFPLGPEGASNRNSLNTAYSDTRD